jgi:hypothetical protein
MSLIRTLTAYDAYIREEFKAPPPGLAWRLRSLVSGHPSHSLLMLGEDALRRGDYIRMIRSSSRLSSHNRGLRTALDNKINQKFWLDAVMPNVAPPVKYYITGRQLVPMRGRNGLLGLDAVLNFAEEKGRIFLKPSDLARGVGAMRIEVTGGEFLANGTPTGKEELVRELGKTGYAGYTVSEFIEQGEWSSAFHPRTLNTLRVLTGTFVSRRKPEILASTMRMGRPSTFPVDNWNVGRGGVAALVEPATGKLDSGLIFNSRTKRREWCDAHPDTGARIKDEQVPEWQTIVATMLELASLLPFPGVIGWDVALTPKGLVVVEANAAPSLDLHQCHRSLKSTPEQRAFWAEVRL